MFRVLFNVALRRPPRQAVSLHERLRPAVHTARHSARIVAELTSMPARRLYYIRGRRHVERLPSSLKSRLGLDDPAAVLSRRIEIGSGLAPMRGYIHVDVDRRAPHVEYRASAECLPFADAWADEILAIHVLEHVHPSRLGAVLSEWRRVLVPGGLLRVHVPDSRAIMEAFLASSGGARWGLMGALLGMYANADVVRPEQLERRCDHQILFDRQLLTDVLSEADFADITDFSLTERDRHSMGWEPLVPQISLIFEARKPGSEDSGA